MSQLAEIPCADDELERAFPGSVLTHLLTITTREQISVVIEALSVIRAAGAALEGLQVSRRAGMFEHRVTLTGLQPQQARLVADRLAGLAGVERARVEHQLLRA
jgi:hypothetical protein